MAVNLGNLNTLTRLAQSSTLPPFQREYVWTPAQAELLIDSVVRGFPIGAILVWDPRRRPTIWPAESGMILDGQQRITALTGIRPGGERIHAVYWHFAEERFIVLPGEPDITRADAWPVEGDTWDFMQATRRNGWDDSRAYARAYDALRFNSQVPIHSVGGPLDEAVEAFRRVNSGGTPISPAELDRLTACMGVS